MMKPGALVLFTLSAAAIAGCKREPMGVSANPRAVQRAMASEEQRAVSKSFKALLGDAALPGSKKQEFIEAFSRLDLDDAKAVYEILKEAQGSEFLADAAFVARLAEKTVAFSNGKLGRDGFDAELTFLREMLSPRSAILRLPETPFSPSLTPTPASTPGALATPTPTPAATPAPTPAPTATPAPAPTAIALPTVTLAVPAAQSLAERKALAFSLSSTKNFTGAVAYSCISGCPAGVSVDAGSGAVTWTPTLLQSGTYTFRFRAAGSGDGAGATDEKDLVVTVADNQAPSLAAIATQSLSPGDALSLTLSGSDPDASTTLSYTCDSGCPAGLAVDASSGVATYVPRSSHLGQHTVTFKVSDGEYAATRVVTIDVNLLGSGAAGTVASTSGITGMCYVVAATDTTAGTVTIVAGGLDLTGKRLVLHQTQDRVVGYASGTAATLNAANLPGDAGKWEIVKVTARSGATPDVLTVQPKPLHAFSSSTGRKAQACVALEYENLTMTGGAAVRAPVWTGITGGLLLLMVRQNLSLDVTTLVDASARGYRGGTIKTDAAWPENNYSFLDTNWAYGAAAKGEGPDPMFYNGSSAQAYSTQVTTAECNHHTSHSECYSSSYWLGRGNVFIGGGGGAGIVAGGGGGGLGGTGGYGGWQMDKAVTGMAAGDPTFNPTAAQNDATRGLPGVSFDFLDLMSTRLFPGGGGGAGHSDEEHVSAGGTGGGILLLGAGTVTGSGAFRADGQSGLISTANHKGGGGGGAGGLLWLEVHTLGTGQNLTASAQGGNGAGNTKAEGTGGGGGGGVVHMPRTAIPAGQINVSGGAAGVFTTGSDPRGATGGGAGVVSP